MKSTGEVLGIGKNLEEALYKGLVAAGYNMDKKGGVLITVRDSDKYEIVDVARKYAELGFELYATEGTAKALEAVGLKTHHAAKVSDDPDGENTVSFDGSRQDQLCYLH